MKHVPCNCLSFFFRWLSKTCFCTQPHTQAETHLSFISVFHSRWDVTVSYQHSRLSGTQQYNTHTHTLGWMGLPISRADCSPILGCVVLSHNSVTHAQSFAVSGAYQPPSSQEMLPPLPLFYLIMHLHTLANKPSMLKSSMQTCARFARGMLTMRRIAPTMTLTLVHMQD